MKNPDLFSMFLEIVGYLVLCGSAGYLIVHAIFSIDSLAIWAVKKWRKHQSDKAAKSVSPGAQQTTSATAKDSAAVSDKAANNGKTPQP
jgi:hypothetical protein